MAAQNAHAATTYTVGWIAALAIERAAATAMLDDRHSQPKDFKKNGNDSNQYTWGRIGSHHVVIASLPSGTYGTNAAAVTARSMLASLPWIRTGLLVGIGAGVPNLEKGYDIRLGDVVVSQPQGTTGGVIQYDLAKAKDGTIRPTGMLNMPPEAIRSGIAALQAEHEMMPSTIPDLLSEMALKYPQMAKSTPQKPGYVHQGQDADVFISNGLEVERPARESTEPEIFYGTIASGNLLIKDAEERDAVLARLDGLEDILCFEMEAAGLMNSFPCIVIRGICDYADSDKNDAWQRYASATAACFAKELLGFMDADEVQQTVAIGGIKDLVNDVQEGVEKLRTTGEATHTILSEMRTDEQQRRLREWLKPADPSSNYHNALRRRQDGTGAWLLSGQAYNTCKQPAEETGEPPSLWLHGQSGCGKSILATSIIEDLKHSGTPLIYFYFDFNDSAKQTLDALLRSLLYQIIPLSTKALHFVDELRQSSQSQQPSVLSLTQAVEEVCAMLESMYVVLDALDEAEPRHEVLEWLTKCLASSDVARRFQFFVTSRPETDIRSALKDASEARRLTHLEIQKESIQDDIRCYIRGCLQNDFRLARWNARESIKVLIERELMEKADGMFRWVACQLDSLRDCLTLKELRAALESLPTGLNATYTRILNNIPVAKLPGAIRLLQLLLISPKPVFVDIAVNLLAVNPESELVWDKDSQLVDPSEIVAYCPSLIVVIPLDEESIFFLDSTRMGTESRVVQFAHSSVKQYLVSVDLERPFWRELSSVSAGCSMTPIMLCAIDETYDGVLEDDCDPHPGIDFRLGDFSSEHWADFAAHADESPVISALVADWLMKPETIHKVWRSPRDTIISVAVSYGLRNVVAILLEKGADLKTSTLDLSNFKIDPLEIAAGRQDKEMVDMLLQYHAYPSMRALQISCRTGNYAICEKLLKAGAKTDPSGGQLGEGDAPLIGLSPLAEACRRHSFDLVKLLLDHGAQVNNQCPSGTWPLLEAINSCARRIRLSSDTNLDVVALLLESGADPDLRFHDDGKPLFDRLYNGFHHRGVDYGKLLSLVVEYRVYGGKRDPWLPGSTGAWAEKLQYQMRPGLRYH